MQHSLIDILGLHNSGIVSIIGAGGKTSLMYCLAKELAGIGKKVLSTSTTKIMKPEPRQSPLTIMAESAGDLISQSQKHLTAMNHFTAVGSQDPETGKLTGLDPKIIDRLWQSSPFDWIIVEADGAKRKPLKSTDVHEPVIPKTTTHLILVEGLDALGKPLIEENVHRSVLYSQITGLHLGKPVDEISMAVSAERELLKAAALPSPPSLFVVLNKADTKDRLDSATTLAGLLRQRNIVDRVVVATLNDTRPIKAWFDCQRQEHRS